MATEFNQWLDATLANDPSLDPRGLVDYHRQTYGYGPTEDDYADWAQQTKANDPTLDDEGLRNYYTQTYGEIDPAPSDTANAVKDFWSETKGLVGGARGLINANLGDTEDRDAGFQTYQENMADVQSRHRPQYDWDYLSSQGSLGDWVDAVQYHGLKGLLSVGTGLGLGGLGGLVAKTGVQQAAKMGVGAATEEALKTAGKAGFYSGLGGYIGGTSGGEVYGAAGEEAIKREGSLDGVDLGRVNLATGLHAGTEFATEALMLGMGRLLPEGALSGAIQKLNPLKNANLLTRAGAGLATGAALEGGEEGVQTAIEYWGAEKPLGTPEMWRDVKQGMFAGAIGGGPAGAIMGAVGGRDQTQAPPPPGTDPTVDVGQAPPAAPVPPAPPAPGPTPSPAPVDILNTPPASPAALAPAPAPVAPAPDPMGVVDDVLKVPFPPRPKALTDWTETVKRGEHTKPQTVADQEREETSKHPAIVGLDLADPLRKRLTKNGGRSLTDNASNAWDELQGLSTVEEVDDWFSSKPYKSPNLPLFDHLATRRRAELAQNATPETTQDAQQNSVQSPVASSVSPAPVGSESLVQPPAETTSDTPAALSPETQAGVESTGVSDELVREGVALVAKARGIDTPGAEVDLFSDNRATDLAGKIDRVPEIDRIDDAERAMQLSVQSLLDNTPDLKPAERATLGLLFDGTKRTQREIAAELTRLGQEQGFDPGAEHTQTVIRHTNNALKKLRQTTAANPEAAKLVRAAVQRASELRAGEEQILPGLGTRIDERETEDAGLAIRGPSQTAGWNDNWGAGGSDSVNQLGLTTTGDLSTAKKLTDDQAINDVAARDAREARPLENAMEGQIAAIEADLTAADAEQTALRLESAVVEGDEVSAKNAAKAREAAARARLHADGLAQHIGPVDETLRARVVAAREREALLAEQARVMAEAQARHNQEMLTQRRTTAATRWSQVVPNTPFESAPSAVQDKWLDFSLEAEELLRENPSNAAAIDAAYKQAAQRAIQEITREQTTRDTPRLSRDTGGRAAVDDPAQPGREVGSLDGGQLPGSTQSSRPVPTITTKRRRVVQPPTGAEPGATGEVTPPVTDKPAWKMTEAELAAKEEADYAAEQARQQAYPDEKTYELTPEQREIVAKLKAEKARGNPRAERLLGDYKLVQDAPNGHNPASLRDFFDAAQAFVGETKFGEPTRADKPTTREAFTRILTDLIGRGTHWRITTHETVEQARAAGVPENYLAGTSGKGAYGWVETKNGKTHATFILERIGEGQELSAFMHEVGAHIGLEGVLNAEQIDRLFWKIVEWGDAGRNGATTQEAQIAMRAMARIGQAQTPDQQIKSELLAYFTEEAVRAGIDPTALSYQSELGRWFRTLWAAFKTALRKLGFHNIDNLTPQHVVDLAYGAARLELNGAMNAASRDSVVPMSQIRFGEPSDRQVMDQINQLPESVKNSTKTLWEVFKAKGRYLIDDGAFTTALAKRYAKELPSAPKLSKLLTDEMRTYTELETPLRDLSARVYALPKMAQKAVFEYMQWSTRNNAWGHAVPWDAQAVIDPEAQRKFEALKAYDGAQQAVRDASQYTHDLRQKLLDALNRSINDYYDPLIAKATDPKAKQGFIDQKKQALEERGSFIGELKGPYFPLRRFGNYVVVAMSPEMQALREKRRQEIQAGQRGSTATSKRITELETQRRHYVVEQVDTELAAKRRVEALKSSPADPDIVNAWPKEEFRDKVAIDIRAFERLRATIQNSSHSAKVSQNLTGVVDGLILAATSEYSAKQANQHRRKIHGEEADMMRSLESWGLAASHMIAHLEHQRDVNQTLFDLSNEAKREDDMRGERTRMWNELYKRYEGVSQFEPAGIQDSINKFTGFWLLALSPRFYFQQMLQTGMLTQPRLGAKHGYFAAWKALNQAMADVLPIFKGAKLSQPLDLSKIKYRSDSEKRLIEEMVARQRIDIGVGAELGSELASRNRLTQLYDRTLRKLPNMLEVLNRSVAALAAYRLEQVGSGHGAAMEYADEVIQETHFSYNKVDRPRMISQYNHPHLPAKMLFQFKTYQFGVLNALGAMTHDAFKGSTPQEKAVARAMLKYTLGHQIAMAGAFGLPAMYAIAPALAFVIRGATGDDEPDDFETLVREGVEYMGGTPGMADVLLYGAPTVFGTSLTSAVGMGSIIPYADLPKYNDTLPEMVMGALGPAAGLSRNFAAGFGWMGRGEYYRGLETMMPNGLKQAMTAGRRATEGETTYTGDTVLKPEDISAWNTLSQLAGFQPMNVQKRRDSQNALKKYEKNFADETSQIKRAYSEAKEAGNRRDQHAQRNAWLKLQSRKRAAGFKPAPLSDLSKAPYEQAKRERQTDGGVPYDTGNRRFVERRAELVGL